MAELRALEAMAELGAQDATAGGLSDLGLGPLGPYIRSSATNREKNNSMG